jgi:hypothetical protein
MGLEDRVQQLPAIDGIIDDEDFGSHRKLPSRVTLFPSSPTPVPQPGPRHPLSPRYLMRLARGRPGRSTSEAGWARGLSLIWPGRGRRSGFTNRRASVNDGRSACPILRASNEHLPFSTPLFGGVAEAALNCAHRATVSHLLDPSKLARFSLQRVAWSILKCARRTRPF